jgi:hypothetical protein
MRWTQITSVSREGGVACIGIDNAERSIPVTPRIVTRPEIFRPAQGGQRRGVKGSAAGITVIQLSGAIASHARTEFVGLYA